MSDLIIHKLLDYYSAFGLWKWSKEDHLRPLNFQLDGARSKIFVEENRTQDHPIQIVLNLKFNLIFEDAPKEYIIALKSRGDKATKFAYRIYNYFVDTISRFEKILRVFGKVRNLTSVSVPSIYDFYNYKGISWHNNVTWQIENHTPQKFQPKLDSKPRRKNPLFKHPQLITVDKWKRFQTDINTNRLPSDDIVELHRIISDVYPKSKRIPVVEAAILIESKLKTYAEAVLKEKEFSQSKIKELKDDITFNIVLNLLLPLTLTKTEIKRIKQWLPLVDRIRKLRNEIVHNNLQDNVITESEVINGIFSAVDLFEFIDGKIKK